MMPNPSLEARPNGRPPGRGRWYGYIFTGPGLASYRRARLSSNVSRQESSRPLKLLHTSKFVVQKERKHGRREVD